MSSTPAQQTRAAAWLKACIVTSQPAYWNVCAKKAVVGHHPLQVVAARMSDSAMKKLLPNIKGLNFAEETWELVSQCGVALLCQQAAAPGRTVFAAGQFTGMYRLDDNSLGHHLGQHLPWWPTAAYAVTACAGTGLLRPVESGLACCQCIVDPRAPGAGRQ